MRIVLIAALSIIAAISRADAGFAYIIDPNNKASYEVVTTRIGEVENPLGINTKLTISGFAGVGSKDRVIGGFAGTFRFNVAKNAALDLGPAFALQGGKIKGAYVLVGVTWRY